MSTSKRRVPSRLLKSLFEEASSTRNRVTWARAVCRAAAHQARSGEVDEALTSIAAVRKEFGVELHPEVGCWLMLAEGILHWCQFEFSAAYGRMIRAHALASALKSANVLPSCAAWLSLLEFNNGEFAKMANYLNQAFSSAAKTDHHARFRATLVLATGYLMAGRYELARPWFEEARLHATAEGDQASLGAMLFNVAVARLVDLRISDAFGEPIAADMRRASTEASGSASFDLMTGNNIQSEWRLLMQGRQNVLERKYKDALVFLDMITPATMTDEAVETTIIVDRAWCFLNIGDISSALSQAGLAERRLETLKHADDVAYCLARLASIFGSGGLPDRAAIHQERAIVARDNHKAFQQELLLTLEGIQANSTHTKNPA